MIKLLFIFGLLILSLLYVKESYAHPGNTAADNCHYCRTNCDRWGEAWGVRHCHGGGGYTPQPITPVFPVVSADYKWWPNNDEETFDVNVILDDPNPSSYSVSLNSYANADPGNLVDFPDNDFYFYDVKPGTYYINAKKNIGGQWSTIRYWEITIPEWYPPQPTPEPTSEYTNASVSAFKDFTDFFIPFITVWTSVVLAIIWIGKKVITWIKNQ